MIKNEYLCYGITETNRYKVLKQTEINSGSRRHIMKCTVFSVQVSLLVRINQIWPEKQTDNPGHFPGIYF